MTNDKPGVLGVQTNWKGRFRVPMWRCVRLADAVGMRARRSGQEDGRVVLATLARPYSQTKRKWLRDDFHKFLHMPSFHQPPSKDVGGQSVNLTSKPGFKTPLQQHKRVWSSVWINTALAMRFRLGWLVPCGSLGEVWMMMLVDC